MYNYYTEKELRICAVIFLFINPSFFSFSDIMMARGIVRECVQDVDKLSAAAASSNSSS